VEFNLNPDLFADGLGNSEKLGNPNREQTRKKQGKVCKKSLSVSGNKNPKFTKECSKPGRSQGPAKFWENASDDVSGSRKPKVTERAGPGQTPWPELHPGRSSTMDLHGGWLIWTAQRRSARGVRETCWTDQEGNPLISTTASELCSQTGCWDHGFEIKIRDQWRINSCWLLLSYARVR